MESTPLSPEVSTDDTGTAKKKKKAADVAVFIIEKPEPAKSEASDSFGLKRRPQPSEKVKDEPEVSHAPETVSDEEAIAQSPGDLSKAETARTFQKIAQGRLAELPAETGSPDIDASESVEDQASRLFLEKISESGDPEQAIAETTEAIGLEPDRTEETLPEFIDVPLEGDVSSVGTEDQDEDSTQARSAANGALPLALAGAAGGGGQPPRKPRSPTANSPQPPQGSPGSSGSQRLVNPSSPQPGFYSPGPNTAPAASFNTMPNSVPVADAEYFAHRAEVRGLLVGGIVGYLIGRRRGRIKTQKKLLPVQKKLQKKVSGLQNQLLDTEYRLRESVAKQNKLKPVIVPKIEKRAPAPVTPDSFRPLADRRPARPTLSKEKPALVIKRTQTERIGHMLIAKEAPSIAPRVEARLPIIAAEEGARKEVPTKSPAERSAIEKDVLTMSRSELLLLSEKISIDGANLRQVYETHLLGEKGLRRVVTEYLRGGDVKRMLRRELVEREIDYDRDPKLRDRAKSALNGAGRKSVDNLLEQAGVSIGSGQRPKLPLKPLSEEEARPQQLKTPKKHNQLMDVGLAGTILVLIALIIVLLALHH